MDDEDIGLSGGISGNVKEEYMIIRDGHDGAVPSGIETRRVDLLPRNSVRLGDSQISHVQLEEVVPS